MSQPGDSFIAVHFGHLDIHENDVVVLSHGHFQAFATARCHIAPDSDHLEYPLDDLLVHKIVLDDEDVKVRRLEVRLVLHMRLAVFLDGRSGRFGERRVADRQGDREEAAEALFAAHVDGAPNAIEDFSAHRKPDARASMPARVAGIGRAECFEKSWQGLAGYSDPRILDDKPDHAFFAGLDRKPHESSFGKFDAIANDVVQDLADAAGIGFDKCRRIHLDIHVKIEVAGAGLGRLCCDDFPSERGD